MRAAGGQDYFPHYLYHGFFIMLAIILYMFNGRFPDWYYLEILYYSACTFFLVLGLCYATSAIVVLFRTRAR